MVAYKHGYLLEGKITGIRGNCIAGEDDLRTFDIVKKDTNGKITRITSSDSSDDIYGVIVYGNYKTPTLNGKQKIFNYQRTDNGDVVKDVDYEVDNFNKGDACNVLINRAFVCGIVEEEVNINDDVYYNVNTRLLSNTSGTGKIRVGKSTFASKADNGVYAKVDVIL